MLQCWRNQSTNFDSYLSELYFWLMTISSTHKNRRSVKNYENQKLKKNFLKRNSKMHAKLFFFFLFFFASEIKTVLECDHRELGG